jgi:uncharacterized protein YlzI (FlbEa/FlbD family)
MLIELTLVTGKLVIVHNAHISSVIALDDSTAVLQSNGCLLLVTETPHQVSSKIITSELDMEGLRAMASGMMDHDDFDDDVDDGDKPRFGDFFEPGDN